jgi:hypothetical protein
MSPWIYIFSVFFALSINVQSDQDGKKKERWSLIKRKRPKSSRNRKRPPADKPDQSPITIGRKVDQWASFWSKYAANDPKKHLVSYSKKSRKIVLDHPAGYIMVDKECVGNRYKIIPANTWVDHATGNLVDGDQDLSRIQRIEGPILSSDDMILRENIHIGYLPILNTSEKKDGLDVQLIDGKMTLSQFMKEKKAHRATKKTSSLRVNGWHFQWKETKDALYGVGIKGNQTITLFRQNQYHSGVVQPSHKELICSAIAQKDGSLQIYTFDQMVVGKQMAKQVLMREISQAIGRTIPWDDMAWGEKDQSPTVYRSNQTKGKGLKSPYMHPIYIPYAHQDSVLHRDPVPTAYSTIPFEEGRLNNPPLGCLQFGISRKANPKALSDQTGTYYVYVDYVVSKDETEPMDRDLMMAIAEQVHSYRVKKVNALPSDQKDKIRKPVDERRSFGDANIVLIPSSECAYQADRCTDLDTKHSTPVNNTGSHFTLPVDQFTRLLDNGEFYAYSRHQSGINWKDELDRMAGNIVEQRWNSSKGRQTHNINGWTIESCVGEKGVYGFAHDAGRTITFGQVKKEGIPVNIGDVFYRAWKIFDKQFKTLRLSLKLKNNVKESDMMDVLNKQLLILTGQNLNQVTLESQNVQGVFFKMATVVLKTKEKIQSVLKYGILDQSKQPGSTPMIVVVGHVPDPEKQRKPSDHIDESMVGLLEKDLGLDFSCLVKGFAVESQMDQPLSSAVGQPEGEWKEYALLALSGL